VGTLAAAAGVGWSWRRAEAEAVNAAGVETLWGQRFPRPQGGELVMAEQRGQALLINFWATWCAPCVKEMPELDRFARAQGARVKVIGLAIDKLVPVQDFLAKYPMSFAIGLAGMDGSDLARSLGNPGGLLPFTVLLDAKGKVVQRKLGETNVAELEVWVKHL
jgi:thiol-disulfide isomerase/thioredoxin